MIKMNKSKYYELRDYPGIFIALLAITSLAFKDQMPEMQVVYII